MPPSFLTAAAAAGLATGVLGDVYMHNPRGSNDRACENNDNRQNGNRLFDSQNNDNGGYACGRAWPFSCYTQETQALRNTCNQINAYMNDTLPPDAADNDGVLHPLGTRTPRLYFYEGSILTVEWTMQHGCGENPRLNCDISLQYACEDTLTDDCGEPTSGKVCGPRDGIPVTNSNLERGSTTYTSYDRNRFNTEQLGRRARDQEATRTIPVSTDYNVQSDPRFGRHETLQYYVRCAYRERNKGLFAADRQINGDDARFTRQNNNGDRDGLECPEESEYWPYWADSPWKDIAYLTNRPERCPDLVAQSQNVVPKWECDCPSCIAQNTVVPNGKAACTQRGGTWRPFAAFNIAPPVCGMAPNTRENHLGSTVGGGKSAAIYNWTLPTNVVAGQTCILRLRYNISTGDPGSDGRPVTLFGTAADNGANSPIKDRQNSEVGSYKSFVEYPADTYPGARVGLEMNTNQFGRTFQDRSHSFRIVRAPETGECAGKRIFNLNVRGKRGNIVQVYPSVEYDFMPSELYVSDTTDCVHVQWTGSDYGEAQNDNNAFGGPPDPRNLNNGRADRHNLVQLAAADQHHPVKSLNYHWNMFSTSISRKMHLAFIGQPIEDPNVCMPIENLVALSAKANADQNNPLYQSTDGINSDGTESTNRNNYLNNDEDRDRYYQNCGKLSGARTPYFDGGLFVPGPVGDYAFMSTRDNSFSNRHMLGILRVQSAILNNGNIVLVVVGSAVAMGLAGAAIVFLRRRRRFRGTKDVSTPAGGMSFRGTPGKGEAAAGAAAAVPVPAVPARARPGLMAAQAPAAAGGSGGAAMTVTALYNHVPSEAGELAFKKGDIITVLRRDDAGWWEGRGPDGAKGIFPVNYTSPSA